MPTVGTAHEKGDLYGRVDVLLPSQLSAEERAHYEALAKLSGGAANTHSAA
jgi:DnaJ-class molecular chaperone